MFYNIENNNRLLSNNISHAIHLVQYISVNNFRRNCEPLEAIIHSTIENETKTWVFREGTRSHWIHFILI